MYFTPARIVELIMYYLYLQLDYRYHRWIIVIHPYLIVE